MSYHSTKITNGRQWPLIHSNHPISVLYDFGPPKTKVLRDCFWSLFLFFSFLSLLGFPHPWKNVCNIFHKHHHLLMYCKSETARLFGCLVMSEVSSFIKRSNAGKCFSSENPADEKLLRAHPKFCLTPDL